MVDRAHYLYTAHWHVGTGEREAEEIAAIRRPRDCAEAAMNYREEIETALKRDGTRYGKVWRDETDGLPKSDINRIWKQLHVMLDRKAVKTTPAQKKRWGKRLSGFARAHGLSRITAAEIARRAERYILA